MSKHTPGPWTAIKDANEGEGFYVILTDDEDAIATGLHEPDARLIAAAPDLLAALKMADTILDGFPLYATGHGAKTIRAAIAKAEGGS